MSLYFKIKHKLPNSWQGYLERKLFQVGLKPTYNKKIGSRLDKGIVVFSADFEMAWAFRFSKKRNNIAVNMGLQERNNFPLILNEFNKHNIPVTWATVGNLLLDHCEKGIVHSHTEMPRPNHFENRNWHFSSGDWYDHDPCSTLSESPAWYASDLVDMIQASPVNHEIGCHTFSHIDCTYKNCSKELIEAELRACMLLADKRNIKLQSFVFPGGTYGNYEALKEAGFICYRKKMSSHIDFPYIDENGLVAIPSGFGLDRDPYGWSPIDHCKIIEAYVLSAIRNKQVCHFWFHPSMDPWYVTNVLPKILAIINNYREEGRIEILTMGELARKIMNI